MKKYLFILFLPIVALSQSTNPMISVFPENPKSTSACFKAGQSWIQKSLLEKEGFFQDKATDFNRALSECTWKAPEAKLFKWKPEYEHMNWYPMQNAKNPNYPILLVPIIARAPNGDWLLTSTYGSYGERAGDNVYQISKEFKIISEFSVPNQPDQINFFLGFDFANYILGSPGKALGIQDFTNYPGSRSINLRLAINKQGVLFSSEKSFAIFDSKNQKWNPTECTFDIQPDSQNDRNKIHKNCKGGLKSKSIYRWNGNSYTTDPIDEWLTKLNRKNNNLSAKNVKIIDRVVTSDTKKIGKLEYNIVTHTKTPQGHPTSWTAEYFQITSGLDKALLKKINTEIKQNTMKDFELIEHEFESENGDIIVRYGESKYQNKIVAYYENILSIMTTEFDMPPNNRAYDLGSYYFYNLVTGEKKYQVHDAINAKRFYLWLLNTNSDKFLFVFPDSVTVIPGYASPPEYVAIPTESGLDFRLFDNGGGHFFETPIGIVPYRLIAKNWLSSDSWILKLVNQKDSPLPGSNNHALFIPKMNCHLLGDEHHMTIEEWICKTSALNQYEILVQLSQFKYEQFMNDESKINLVAEQHAQFLSSINLCFSNKDEACLVREIKKRQTQLDSMN